MVSPVDIHQTSLHGNNRTWRGAIQRLSGRVSGRPMLIIVPVAVLFATIGLTSVRQTNRQQIADQLQANLEATSLAVQNWCEERRRDAAEVARVSSLLAFAARMTGETSPETSTAEGLALSRQIREDLLPLCERHGFDGFFVTDPRGTILLSPGTTPPSGAVADIASRNWADVLAGEAVLLPPRFYRFQLHLLSGSRLENWPVVMAVAPIPDPEQIGNGPVAILWLVLSPDRGFSQLLEAGSVGQSGESYAFDASGWMISNSRFDADLKRIGVHPGHSAARSALPVRLTDPGRDLTKHPLPPGSAIPGDLPLTRMCASAIRGENGLDVIGYRDYRGVEVVGAWKWFPEYGFGITSEIDTAEAFAGINTAFRIFWLMLIPIVLGTALSECNACRKRKAEGEQSRLIGELERQTVQLEARNGQLREAYRAANIANDAKSRFLANMSHEIRTPLNAVLGLVDILRVEGRKLSDSSRDDYLDTIHRSGTHLLGLINDVLDLSKIEAGKLEVEHRDSSVVEVMEDVASIMGAKAAEKQLELVVQYETEIPERIVTDAQRLQQVLINLVGNAIKFTNSGQVKVAVRAPSDVGNNLIEFRVEDTGCGMSPEALSKIFEPFAQGGASVTRRFGGTGLGLTISRKFCEALGGTITVTSAVGKGSCFAATVAMGDLTGVGWSRVQRRAPRDTRGDRESAIARLTGRRVLIVDDGETNRGILRVFLKRTGCEVFEASDGIVALRSVRQIRPDAVLMDMQMPRLDGYATTRRLRSDGFSGTVIACSADALRENIDRMFAAGCDAIVPKPVSYPVLVEQLLAAIARREEVGNVHWLQTTIGVTGEMESTTTSATVGTADPDLAAVPVPESADAIPV